MFVDLESNLTNLYCKTTYSPWIHTILNKQIHAQNPNLQNIHPRNLINVEEEEEIPQQENQVIIEEEQQIHP